MEADEQEEIERVREWIGRLEAFASALDDLVRLRERLAKLDAANARQGELDNLAEHFREPGRLPWDQRDLTHPGDDDNHE